MAAHLNNISSALEKGESVYQAYEDAKRIKAALAALDDGTLMRYDPVGAAATFGLLFQGVGGLAKNLPAPGKAAGVALIGIGQQFANVYKMTDPTARSGWGGDQLKQLREEGLF